VTLDSAGGEETVGALGTNGNDWSTFVRGDWLNAMAGTVIRATPPKAASVRSPLLSRRGRILGGTTVGSREMSLPFPPSDLLLTGGRGNVTARLSQIPLSADNIVAVPAIRLEWVDLLSRWDKRVVPMSVPFAGARQSRTSTESRDHESPQWKAERGYSPAASSDRWPPRFSPKPRSLASRLRGRLSGRHTGE
jgi:hypothetical protein